MDAERKVAAAIFLTAVGKHRRWKGEQIYHPKKTIFFLYFGIHSQERSCKQRRKWSWRRGVALRKR